MTEERLAEIQRSITNLDAESWSESTTRAMMRELLAEVRRLREDEGPTVVIEPLWIPFTCKYPLPPARRFVLVAVAPREAREGIAECDLPAAVAVGYLRYLPDSGAPFFVIPGMGGPMFTVTHWCDYLSDNFSCPLWLGSGSVFNARAEERLLDEAPNFWYHVGDAETQEVSHEGYAKVAVEVAVDKLLRQRNERLEMLAAAFLRVSEFPPEECMLVEQRMDDGLTTRWWFERQEQKAGG